MIDQLLSDLLLQMFNIMNIIIKSFDLLIYQFLHCLTSIFIVFDLAFNPLYAFQHTLFNFLLKLDQILLCINANICDHLIDLIESL